VAVVADQTLMPIIDSEKMVFESLYKDAKIDVAYFNQNQAFKNFLENDTVRLIVASRRLDKTEEAFLVAKQLVPRTVRLAVDGIALVVHPNFADSIISFETLNAILNGKQTNYKGITSVVFDNANSGVIQFLKDSIFTDFDVENKNFFAQKTSGEVLDYIKTHKNCLGLMSACWIADAQAAENTFVKEIKVLAVSPKGNKRYYYKPFEYYLSKGNYPLARNIYAISREPRTGLGTGFASFMAGQKGQLIIARTGLLPASIPVRTVEIVKE
jgi:phosphate transport system substrate-binding protein